MNLNAQYCLNYLLAFTSINSRVCSFCDKMLVFNVLFSKGLGGIEQAFLDYTRALQMQGIKVLPIVHPKAKIKDKIDIPYEKINNLSQYDLFSILRLKRLIDKYDPQVIIAHGNRAINLCNSANRGKPLVAVVHNNRIKFGKGVSHVFAVAHHLRHILRKAGFDKEQLSVIPNMIHFSNRIAFDPPILGDVLRIGTLCRIDEEKGVGSIILAAKILQEAGIKCEVVIGGEGSEKDKLQELANSLKLHKHVRFLGWVEDKDAFFKEIDVFCLASKRESFGIVLLEAMIHSKFIVATSTKGASEILEQGRYGLLTRIDDPNDLANALINIKKTSNDALERAKEAFKNVSNYSSLEVSRKLKLALENIYFHSLMRD